MKTRKLKRRLALFVAVIMTVTLWTAVPLQASADETAGDFKYTVADGNATITGYTGSDTDVAIPATVGASISVTSIANDTFQNNTQIVTVRIPASVTSVGNNAFAGCTSFTTIVVDGNNTSFSSLDGVLFNKEQTTLMRYPQGKQGASYEIPASVETFISIPFRDNINLTAITVAEGNTSYSASDGVLFSKDTTVLVTYPAGKSGTTYNIPDSVQSIGNGAFVGNVSLEEIDLNNVKNTGIWTFQGCTNLETMELPAGITTIGEGLFSGCTNLEEVTIPDSVTSIGGSAFIRCTSLASVTIPKDVASFGVNVFYGCASLETATIANGVRSIGGNMFNGCTNLEEVTIPDSVTSIGGGAFAGCTSLAEIEIPDSVASIGTWAFQGCTELTSIVLPDGITAIGEGLFAGCTNLEEVTIPDSVTSIGSNAFSSCASLASIAIPKAVANFGNNIFYGCIALETVTIADGVKSIVSSMFSGCTSLETVTIPDSVTTIGYGAFIGCTSLTEIEIPDSVVSLGTWVFQNCTQLGSIVLPASIPTIGDGLFANCTSLTDITVLGTTTTYNNANAFPAALQKIWLYDALDTNLRIWANNNNKTVVMIEDMAVTPSPSPLNLSTDGTNGPTGGTLSASFTPAGSYTEQAPTVTWSTSNASVAGVDSSNGAVTQVGPGTATITATADTPLHSGVVLTKHVPVNVSVSSSEPTYTLTVTGGSVVGPSSNGEYPATAQVTITAADVAGQEFVEWTGVAGTSFTNGTDQNSSTAVFTMSANEVTITAAYKWAEPEAAIDYAAEELTGLIAGETYTFGGVEGVAAGGIYAIDSSWLDSTLSIVKKSDGAVADSDPQSLPIPARLAAPAGIAKTNQTAAGQNDGTITGVTADMEWKGTSGNWQTVAGQEITGLAPGTYQVRTKATSSHFASAAATLIIAAYVPPAPATYAVTVMGGSGSGAFEEGATVTITANAPAEGKVFGTWMSDEVTFTSATSATTTFTMPAKAVTVMANYKDDPNTGGGDDTYDPPVTDGWVYEDGVWEYLVDGEVVTGWIYDQSKWYYTNAVGEMQTGWIYASGKWYYLAGNGAMKTGWLKDNGSWYYLSGNGAMVAGKWFKDTDGSWYYLSGNGKMLTGKQNIGGKAYTFKTNGVWVS
jgi:hypothetical protein